MAGKSFRDRNKITVGLVSSATLIALVLGVYVVGTRGVLLDRYTVTGVFADTGGLRSGDEVRMAGIDIGEVTDVRPDYAKGQVLVSWEVDAGVDLGPATRAAVTTENVLGGRYLRLSGDVTTPHLADLADDRRRIPLERTQVPTTVNDALDSSTRTINRLDTAAINKIVAEVSGIDAGQRGRLSSALRNLAELAETVEESDPEIQKLLDGGNRVLDLAKAKDQQLSQLLGNVRIMLTELERRRTELATFLGSGSGVAGEMAELIDKRHAQLKSVIADLQSTLGDLRPATGDFNSLLAWAGPTLSGLAGAGGNGPWVDIVATGLGPLSPQDLAGLAANAPQEARP